MTEKEYDSYIYRIEELMDSESGDDLEELKRLTKLISEYDEKNNSLPEPEFKDVRKYIKDQKL